MRSAAVDHGADIGQFSQYPGEREYLWNPLSLVEPNGQPFVEDTPDGIVTILPVRMNMNVKSMTVDELVGQKKAMHLSSFKFMINEVASKLEEISPEISERIKADRDIVEKDRAEKLRALKSGVVAQCSEAMERHAKRPDEDYLDHVTFRSLVMEMLDFNMFAHSKVRSYVEDPSSMLRLLHKSALRNAHRRYVSFLERSYAQKQGPEDVRRAAWELCRVKGLLTGDMPAKRTGWNALEVVADVGEPRIVAAASEDLSSKSLRLLVAARANVNAVDRYGNTAIMRAAAMGNDGAIRTLQELGGDPNKVRDDGTTAMHLAAWEGHVACIRALNALGVHPEVATNSGHTPLMGAAENGHADAIIELAKLINSKKGMDAENSSKMTAVRCAAKYNHIECIRALNLYNATVDCRSLILARHFGDPMSDLCYDCVKVLAQLVWRPAVGDRVQVVIDGVNCVGKVAKTDESVHPFYVKFDGEVESDGWYSRQEILRFMGDGCALPVGCRVLFSAAYAAQLCSWHSGAGSEGSAEMRTDEVGQVKACYKSQSQCLDLYHVVFPSGLHEGWYTSDELEPQPAAR